MPTPNRYLPRILLGSNILTPSNLAKLINRPNVHPILITTPHLLNLYSNQLNSLKIDTILLYAKDIQECQRLLQSDFPPNVMLVSFGGGRVSDITKYLAHKHHIEYISIPSTLSHDGLISPVIVLEDSHTHHKFRFTGHTPYGLLIDLQIIKQSPRINIQAGIGDLISNQSALDDWVLAEHMGKDHILPEAFEFSKKSFRWISQLTHELNILDPEFLQSLALGLINSGYAMILSGNSRPASGSEHLISHSIDQLYPKRTSLHGIQTAYGCLLVERHVRHQRYSWYHQLFKKLNMLDTIFTLCNFTPQEETDLLEHALQLSDRYTIIHHQAQHNLLPLSHHQNRRRTTHSK